jgi:hypothetical protein
LNEKEIIVIGGFDNDGNVLNVVEIYNIELQEWRDAPTTNTPRKNASAVTIGTEVYVIGGWDSISTLRSVEKFSDGRWDNMTCTPMRESRECAGAVALTSSTLLEENKDIFVCGGYNGLRTVASCEMYNVSQNQWIPIDPMSENKECIAMTPLENGSFAVVGGWDGYIGLSTTEVYNIEEKKWVKGNSLIETRNRPWCLLN